MSSKQVKSVKIDDDVKVIAIVYKLNLFSS
jgi:hypothetical protein